MDEGPGVSLFQGANINLENAVQNQEEDEDIEDQIRRQEEIQNLLLKEMDEFNYDESSVDSSVNVSVDETDQYGLMQKYRDTSMNNQLKVLYEVRVREVLALKKQLEDVHIEFEHFKKDSKRHMLLLEAEKDQINISYKQTQDMLVNKSEEISKLSEEIVNRKAETNQLNGHIDNLRSENIALQRANEELQLKLTLSKEAISTNTITDRNIMEQHQAELHRLNISLDSALGKLDKKEKQNKELEQKLRELTKEKDESYVEKCTTINKLTAQLESSQSKTQELLEVIEKLSLDNQSLKKASSENNSNNSTNVLNLLEKSEFIKGLQKELEKTQSNYQNETAELSALKASHERLKEEYEEKVKKLEKYQTDLEIVSNYNNTLESELNSQSDELTLLRQKVDELRYIQSEKEAYDKRVRELEKILMEVNNKSCHDNALQVSDIMMSGEKDDELERMEKDLNLAYHNIEQLNLQLVESKEQINSLTAQIRLSEERDNLLKALQEKAAQFEKVIMEKQTNKTEELTATKGTNTDSFTDEAELIKAKYETDLIQKEIEIRRSIQSEMNGKYEKLQRQLTDYKKAIDMKCSKCAKLETKLKELHGVLMKLNDELKHTKQSRQEDRESVAKLLDAWKEKFQAIEVQNRELAAKYTKSKRYCEDLVKQIKVREDEEKRLIEMIKNEAEVAVKYWHKQALIHAIAATESSKKKIKEADDNFDVYSKRANKEIELIEQEFQKKKRLLENKLKKYS